MLCNWKWWRMLARVSYWQVRRRIGIQWTAARRMCLWPHCAIHHA